MKTSTNVATKLPSKAVKNLPAKFLKSLTGIGTSVILTVIACALMLDFQITGHHYSAMCIAISLWVIQIAVPEFLKELPILKGKEVKDSEDF